MALPSGPATTDAAQRAPGPGLNSGAPPTTRFSSIVASSAHDDARAQDSSPLAASPPLELDFDDDEFETAADGFSAFDTPSTDDEAGDAEDLEDDDDEPDDEEARSEIMNAIERVVKEGAGLAVSEIARAVGAPVGLVSRLTRKLKHARRIHQAGDRRFARYAGDAATAEAASLAARGSATGQSVHREDPSPRETAAKATPSQPRGVLVTPVRPNLTIGSLRSRIVRCFGLERYAIDLVICRAGDKNRRQLRSDRRLAHYLVED